MKAKLFLTVTTLLVMTLALTGGKDEEAAWFDLENCSLCKNLMAEEGLIESMTMENYVTKHKTVLVMEKLELDVPVDEEIFSQRNMRQ